MIKDSLGGQPLQFVVPQYRNYVYNIPFADTTSYSLAIPIAAKFSSLKSLFITVRDQNTGAVKYFPYSSVSLGISEYQFRVGATTMPAKPPNTLTECFAEVCKAIGSIGDIHYTPSIDKLTYNVATSTANAEVATTGIVSSISSGSFYLGLDLENYAGASKDTLFSGYNSNTDDIYALITLVNAGGAVQTRFDAFANFDSVVVCENGTSYVKF
jgi:hypothetical protein